jgi:hypothetical protein
MKNYIHDNSPQLPKQLFLKGENTYVSARNQEKAVKRRVDLRDAHKFHDTDEYRSSRKRGD